MKYPPDQVGKFAHLLADGHTPEGAVFLLGLKKAHAVHLFNKIRHDLGPQAR